MLKGLIGKKVGMTQIFDDDRPGNPGHVDRSWAMLCYPDPPSRVRMGTRPYNWVLMKSNPNVSPVVNWVTLSATIFLRCAFCVSSG